MALIELEHICKRYRDGEGRTNEVLRDVSFRVEKGEFVSVSGPSGCGKTTLLRILGTLLPADGGTYRLDGTDPLATPELTRNRKIGFVFQDHRLLPQYTVLQNILLPVLATQDAASAEQEARARSLMEQTGIDALAAQYPDKISGGEAARTALCRALIQQPLLVLADEPTGQLDAGHARAVLSLLKQVSHASEATVLMVTHSEEMAAAAGRHLVIENKTVREK